MTAYLVAAALLSATAAPPCTTTFKVWRHGETQANTDHLLSGGGDDDNKGITALNETGKKQAETLGRLLSEEENLDIIYSSDLSRTHDTATAVVAAYHERGEAVELRLSKQLREILHGQFELTDAKARNSAGKQLLLNLLQEQQPHDRFRFWKLHPLTEETVPEEIVEVEDYLARRETRPETPYQLWKRIRAELVRIAEEHPGATVGISTHGACLSALLAELTTPEELYLAPHYLGEEIMVGDKVAVPSAPKVANCQTVELLYNPQKGAFSLKQ